MDGFLAMTKELEDPRTGNAKRYTLAELLYAAKGNQGELNEDLKWFWKHLSP